MKEENREKEILPEEEVSEADVLPEEEETVSEDALKQMESLRTSLARLQADFANFKSRTERERKDLLKLSNEGLVLKLLPVVDNFERALVGQNPEDPGVAGFCMIYNEFMEILKKEGVSPLVCDGQAFDPNLHHALFLEETDDVAPDHVIETFQKGYKMGDKLIRPAMVKVSKEK